VADDEAPWNNQAPPATLWAPDVAESFSSALGKAHLGKRAEMLPHLAERFESRPLVLEDIEDLVEASDLEDLEDLGLDSTKPELALHFVDLLVEIEELAESGARKILNGAEVEQDLLASIFVDQSKELVADHLNILLVEDSTIQKTDHGDVADFFRVNAALGGRHGPVSPWVRYVEER
jgi:hypothetical protein